MKTISRYIMTLALLITAVGGAWAGTRATGSFENCTGHNGSIHVHGWAYDPDASATSIFVHAYIWYGESVGSTKEERLPAVGILADIERTDVNTAKGITGNHGFNKYVAVPAGTYTVQIFAIDQNGDGNPPIPGPTSGSNYQTYTVTVSAPFTVSFDANGGSDAPANQNKCTGIDLTLSSDQPVREGYTFVGWNTAQDGSGDSYAPGATYTANADVTLYAQWSNNYIEVTPVAEPAANTKQWTFSMSANDVVLTPIYSAATIYSGETETPFETLKEAFANVQDGDVIKLDWNVTLKETVETLLRNGAIKFTLDLNGYIIDGMTPEYAIRLRNGDLMTITDSSLGQTGGLKCQNLVGEQYAKFIFDGGRYTMGQLTADFLNTVCSGAAAALLLADGKEFIDLEGGAEANDGFTVRVGFKTFELAIDSKRFATFYSDMNIEFAEQPAEGVGLYTISSIDADRSTATLTPISGIIPAGTPMLVYNGTEQKQTAKLIVTLDNAQDAITWAPQFKGTATDLEFTADDMAAADYYALSGGKAFAPVKGAGTLGANQCWLQFDKQEIPSARQFTLVFDETTGVSEKGIVDSEKFATATWYDLNGRKVAAPTKKGIYVNNGRKFVVK